MENKIFIIGHKSPDLDSVAAAICYASLKNKIEKTDKYIAAIAGELNKETEYVLNKFGISKPDLMSNGKDKNIILVDHNEFSQAVDGVAEAKLIEVLDHHKIDFKYSEPIVFIAMPWGASCSIVAQEYLNNNIEISKELASLMLSAILVDTVITKSPTCTEYDKNIIEKLSGIAGLGDWKEYGMEIFKVRSTVSALSNMQIIKSDFKDFNFTQGKIGIGQVETVDLSDFSSRENELLKEMENLKKEGSYHSVVLFLTDIINEGSKFLVVTDDQLRVEEALGKRLEDNKVYVEGVISRKKQVAPKFTEVFDK